MAIDDAENSPSHAAGGQTGSPCARRAIEDSANAMSGMSTARGTANRAYTGNPSSSPAQT